MDSPPFAEQGLHVMTKPIGPICNLDCEYCYYLHKEELYPSGERWRMPEHTLSEYIPGLKDSILHRQVLTPWDMEQEYGLTEGNIFHGELSLEQLLYLRPVAGYAKYKTPVQGLWMCASGTHPGGGIMGASGEMAAKAILRRQAA